jgi:hypothetical protein
MINQCEITPNDYLAPKKNQRQEKHPTKCMKCLTFLDYATLRSTNKNIEQKLEEKDGDCGIKTEI